MTYVITQSCCNDASCVAECPVDCIRPTPDDREAFAAAEMLYIDPDSCIDCGACMEACPVGAVAPEDELPNHLSRFAEFNAGYFLAYPLRPSPPAPRATKPDKDRGELSVAVVGAGPSGCYVVEELLERGNATVTVYDSLPTPWGLLRSGVAPDHLHTKDLAALFERTADKSSVTMLLNAAVGIAPTIEDLLGAHHAVVLATGAADPQPWNVPGSDLPGVHAAAEFVAWYNGHPDHADLQVNLDVETAVIVGNGNVALDMARVLLMTPEQLTATDIAEHALQALSASKIREVVVLGRRGPLQAAYTSAEFHALAAMPGVAVIIDPVEARLDEESLAQVSRGEVGYADKLKSILSAEYAAARPDQADKRLVFRYLREPIELHGTSAVEEVQIAVNRLQTEGTRLVARRTGETETLFAGLVLTSTGYRGRAVPGVSFDETTGTIPNDAGRVIDDQRDPSPGLYATGWIRRGATGGLGSSRLDAIEVVDHLVEDFNSGLLQAVRAANPDPHALHVPQAIGLDGWRAIDTSEREAGTATSRPRVKLTSTDDMLRLARAATTTSDPA